MTQQETIVSTMVRRHKTQQWFLPMDFMPPRAEFNEIAFVGYEASARLSELVKEYPDLFESRRQGKYMARRLRIEKAWDQAGLIGGSFGEFLEKELESVGVTSSVSADPLF